TVVALGIGDPKTRARQISDYAARLSSLESVARVDAVTGSFSSGRQILPPTSISPRFAAPNATWLSVVPTVDPQSDAARRLVRQVRDTARPFPVVVGGPSAQLVDSAHSI